MNPICFNSSVLLERFTDFKASTCFSVYSNVFPKGDYINLACYIICFRLEGNIFFTCKIFIFVNFPGDNADVFAASLLASFYNSSSLILSSVVMIRFYILYKRFSLKRKELPDAKVAWITNKEYGFPAHVFVKIHKASKANIQWMIKCHLLKLLLIGNFIIK